MLHRAAARRRLIRATIGVLAIAASVPAATAHTQAASGAWQPGPAIYGVGESANVPVTMGDGTVLRADVYYPTELASGRPAAGPFPALLAQTPYGKSLSGGAQAAQRTGGLSAGVSNYLVQRG